MRFQMQVSREIRGKLQKTTHHEVDSFARRHFRIKDVQANKEAQDRVHTFNAIRAALSR